MADNKRNLRRDADENRMKGQMKKAEGRIRDTLGSATGDTSEQLKGKAKKVEGEIQKKFGEGQDEVSRRDVRRETERRPTRRNS